MKAKVASDSRARLFACVALSALLHAIVLVADRGRAQIKTQVSESASIDVTLRSANAAARPEPQRAERASRWPAPGEQGAVAAPQGAAAAGGEQAGIRIDPELTHRIARETTLSIMGPASPKSTSQTQLGRAIAQAARPDCRVAHAGMGLLAIPFLAVDAFMAHGCKW